MKRVRDPARVAGERRVSAVGCRARSTAARPARAPLSAPTERSDRQLSPRRRRGVGRSWSTMPPAATTVLAAARTSVELLDQRRVDLRPLGGLAGGGRRCRFRAAAPGAAHAGRRDALVEARPHRARSLPRAVIGGERPEAPRACRRPRAGIATWLAASGCACQSRGAPSSASAAESRDERGRRLDLAAQLARYASPNGHRWPRGSRARERPSRSG